MTEYVGLNHRQVVGVFTHHLGIPELAYFRQLIYERTAVQTQQRSTTKLYITVVYVSQTPILYHAIQHEHAFIVKSNNVLK